MFNKGKSKNRSKSVRIDTLIGQYTHIKGDISFSGGLRVDGNIVGNVNAMGDNESVLTLSDLGSIEGEIRVPNLVINGTIIGNVYATEHVELAPKAKVQGNVYYRMLEMVIGAEVNGQLIRISSDNENMLDLAHERVEDSETFQLEQKSNLD
ncbi:MAG: polymer-forming cytoskeletal protein [Gammaproteobacteria bacterium]|nr:polymer-forming cytoskeletal protein [Gammaproteobacteria bacterium]MDT8370705.1 polymer-forming cytoskeletal protein [Gammaproteobacteria bacterium]